MPDRWVLPYLTAPSGCAPSLSTWGVGLTKALSVALRAAEEEPVDPELARYIEYLQKQLLTPDSEAAHDHERFREWCSAGRERLLELLPSNGLDRELLVDEYQASANAFRPDTRFESFSAHGIFEPLLKEILETAKSLGLPPKRPVVLATSTDLSATPASRPSSADHLLFAGLGTYNFCNYWAKAFTSLIMAIAASGDHPVPITRETIRTAVTKQPETMLTAVKLALYHRYMGTTAGFGVIRQPDDHFGFRIELLYAMELFVVAHEVGHFYFEKKKTSAGETSLSKSEELACDLYALTLSRHCSSGQKSWLAFTAGGALLFFRAVAMSTNAKSPSESTHPSPSERIDNLLHAVFTNTVSDQLPAVQAYLAELMLLSDEIEATVRMALEQENTR